MRLRTLLLTLSSLLAFWAASLRAEPVEFRFKLRGPAPENPFAPEFAVAVTLPSGAQRLQPAYYAGKGVYAVRVFPRAKGTYQFGEVRDGERVVEVKAVTPRSLAANAVPDTFIRIDPTDTQGFVRGGKPYFPFGANLAWAQGPARGFYPRALAQFRENGLNWARIWMAHWGSANLDWVPEEKGRPIRPGELSLEVAALWDEIVAAAEANDVAFQLVLHHHGQVSDSVNPNWDSHPWNVRNGGFLKRPEDFFTDTRARELTKRKLRYIVARWGYSPSIMAWELFNEVHFSTAMRLLPPAEAAVTAWHGEMADYLRSIDPEKHLVTTSYENLDGALYQKMDYKQPHLYAADMAAATLALPTRGHAQEKPVFFGEIGDDQLTVSEADRRSGESLLLPIWTSLFGDARFPGQTWYVERLMDSGRLSELGAAVRFAKAAGLEHRRTLSPRMVTVDTAERAPLEVHGALWWMHYPVVDVPVTFDGGLAPERAFLPKNLLPPNHPSPGFPDRARLVTDLGVPMDIAVRIAKASQPGARVEVRVDGRPVAERLWSLDAPRGELDAGATLYATVPAGRRTIEVANTGVDWVLLDYVQFSQGAPTLYAVAKGDSSFVMVLTWNRVGGPAVRGRLQVPGLAAGRWRSVWWDTVKGLPGPEVIVNHGGGALAIDTPDVARMAALILEKLP